MHEMGIAMQIIEIATESIPADVGDMPVERINLKVGRLSAVVADSLRFCFEIAARDTRLSGAELNIEEVPVTAQCSECGHRWTIEGPAFSCEACRSGSIRLLTGRELDIVSIEVAEKGE